jgi:hypothetical protein
MDGFTRKRRTLKKTPFAKAVGGKPRAFGAEPRGPKGPEPMRAKPLDVPKAAPFGRAKKPRGVFGPTL